MRYLSVFEYDQDVLKAFSDIYLKGNWFDLDCTYSKGVFYQGIEEPKTKSDLFPVTDDVIKSDSTNLKEFLPQEFDSVVFDPPFLFRKRKSVNNDKVSKRFKYFKSYEELLEMYEDSLKSIRRVLKLGGYLFFKCQDMTDGKFYDTHTKVIELARKHNYELKDIAIKATKKKLQRDAKQQNCVAKVHSYWIVFKKRKEV